jgi:hypothetical protein
MIKCISRNPKFKNLTIDKIYEGELIDDNYIVTNDAGIRTRYAPKYFRVVPLRYNLNDVTRCSIERVGNNIIIRLVINNTTYIIDGISYAAALNSCGILELNGLRYIRGEVLRIWFALNNIDGTQQELFRIVIESLLVYLRTIAGAWITFTDVIEETPLTDPIMDELADTTLQAVNTNSRNTIKLWIFNK